MAAIGAALVLLGGVGLAGAATDTGVCSDTTTVLAFPGSGEAGYWLNDCIETNAKEIRITFTSTDGLPHQAKANGCFDSGSIGPGQSREVGLFMLGSHVFNEHWEYCKPNDKVASRDGTFIVPNPFANPNDVGPVTVPNEDGSVTIHYICAIHGAAMHGTVTLGKPY